MIRRDPYSTEANSGSYATCGPRREIFRALHAWHFCMQNCGFRMSQFFLQPCSHFWSLVTNLRFKKFLNFIESILVRVFPEGYLMVIGREGFSRIKMISILPWLRASSFNCKASCWRHFAQWQLLERCCKHATTSACIASFVWSFFHLVCRQVKTSNKVCMFFVFEKI